MWKHKRMVCILACILVCNLTACGGSSSITNQATGIIKDSSANTETDAVSNTEESYEISVQTDSAEEASSEKSVIQSNCSYRVKVGKGAFESLTDEKDILLSVRYPRVTLKNADSFEALKNSLKELNKAEESASNAFYEEYKDSAKKQQLKDDSFQAYQLSGQHYVRRADDTVLSLLTFQYEYTGGAHGYYSYTGHSYDAQTGAALTLSDVVTDLNEVKLLLIDLLPQIYPEVSFFDLDTQVQSMNEENFSWCLDYTGITFVFNPYELASYADGAQVVTISYAEYPELFHSKYFHLPDCYSISLCDGLPYQDDFNDDGDQEILTVSLTADEDGDDYFYPTITLEGDGSYDRKTDKEGCYSMEVFLLRAEDGQYYIYLMKTLENDYEVTAVYKIVNHKVKRVGYLNLGLQVSFVDEAYYMITTLTNPESFVGEIRSDALSTYGATAEYHLGIDGLPVISDEWYTCNANITLKLKTATTFNHVDEDGDLDGTIRLEKGTKMKILRTDNQSFVDFELEDGNIVRATVDLSVYPCKVNGVSSEKVFKGMLYAG